MPGSLRAHATISGSTTWCRVTAPSASSSARRAGGEHDRGDHAEQQECEQDGCKDAGSHGVGVADDIVLSSHHTYAA
jgi:hypothetical protein